MQLVQFKHVTNLYYWYWSGFKQEFLGVDPGGSHGMTDSCDTVTHPNPAPLLPGWISGWFLGDSGVKIGFLPQFRPRSLLRLIWYKHFGLRPLLSPSPNVVEANFFYV